MKIKLASQSTKQNTVWVLAPTFGIILFAVLYIVATYFYPGGSQVDKNATGFSWINNYWCNLLNEYAVNGLYNPARPVAMAGMFVLCLTLIVFWFVFAKIINMGNIARLVIQISGTLAMTISVLLLTSIDHDLVTNLASLFGLVAMVATFIGLFKNRWYLLFAFGLLNLLLVGLNNYVYYNEVLIIYLPVVQKITFAMFLTWICSINIRMYKQEIAKRYKPQHGYYR